MLYIIISSYKSSFFAALEKNIAETIGAEYEIIKIDNPGLMSISEAYNKGADKSKYENLLFLHEDVLIQSINWWQILQKYFELPNLGVLGVAGNKRKFNLPTGYHSGIRSDAGFFLIDDRSNKESKQPEFPFKIKVIDGVFIGMRKEVWRKYKFNEKLGGFHFYDVDISLRTSVEFKNYLITDLNIIHFSDGNFGDEWIKSCIRFNKNYNYNFDTFTQKERRDIRNFWYERLSFENINIKNRLLYAVHMGFNKDTLRHCFRFILGIKNYNRKQD